VAQCKQGPTEPPRTQFHTVVLVGLLLFLTTLAVYSPVGTCQFVNYDDNFYVTANPHVQAGLTAESIRWSFSSITAANWHPLTMLSLQLDSWLFGNGAVGFHVSNLIWHALSVWLLFLVLQRATASVRKSAWVAALFALHPLHVESVAWISERKDVLSAFFFVLTLWLYGWYTQTPTWWRYLCVAGSLLLGLMAKSMLVTLPAVLLLLDYWPLRRLPWSGAEASPSLERRVYSFRRLLSEKLPLFALSAVASVVALIAEEQGHALRTIDEKSVFLRLEIAVLDFVV
jgi:hypothetical protein